MFVVLSMIEKNVTYTYSCDEPGCNKVLNCANTFYARSVGWGVARDRHTCYCPLHLRRHKNVGCFGVCHLR